MNFFTLENAMLVSTVFSGISLMVSVFAWISTKTENKIDDQAVEAIEKAKAFVKPLAIGAYHYIEQAHDSGFLPAGADKAFHFMALIREEYLKKFGAPLPAQAESLAKAVMEAENSADSIFKKMEKPANPPVASSL